MYDTPTATVYYNYWSAPCIKISREVKPIEVIAAACRAFKVTAEELLSNSRKAFIVRIRNICFKVLRMKTDLSLSDIGKIFNKDHTTILHGLRCIENELSVPAYRQQMNIDLRRVMELI